MSVRHLNTGIMRAPGPLSRRKRSVLPYFEALECRQLLSGTYAVLSVGQPLGGHVVFGTVVEGTSSVTVENISDQGNFLAGDIHVVARPASAVDASGDVVLGSLLSLNIVVPVGHSKSFPVKLTLPANIAIGNYSILALVTAPNAGLVVASGSGAPLSVDARTFDLAPAFGTISIPTSILNNGVAHKVQVYVGNVGNVAGSATEMVHVALFARPVGGGADRLLTTSADFSIAKLAPNPTSIKSKMKAVTLSVLNTSFPVGAFHLVAVVADATPANDANAANNTAVDGGTITVAAALVDLSVDSVSDTLAATVAGGTAGTVSVTLKNSGNIPDTFGYTVDVFATTDGTIHQGSTPIGTTTTSSGIISNGSTAKVAVKVALPSPVAQTTYTLVARVTGFHDTNAFNDIAPGGAVNVTATPPLLGNLPTTMTFVEVDTPAGVANVQLTSGGDVHYPGGQTVHDSGYFYSTQGPGKSALLQPTITPFGTNNIELKFSGTRPNSLNGKTIVFQSSSAGSNGSFSVLSATLASGMTLPLSGFFRIS